MPEPIFELTSNSDEPTPVVETPTPSEIPTPEVKEDAPAVPDAPEVPGTENPKSEKLMELPDGRKVTPEEFQTLWKDHFYPEYTRKSQELKELKKGNPQKTPGINNSDEPEQPAWKDPNYEPKTYAEIIEIATREAEAKIIQKQEAEQKAKMELETRVTQDLTEIKKIDPSLDESKLFAHANKYGFTDLKSAYANYADVQSMLRITEEKVLNNLKKRDAPVAGSNNPKPIVSNEEVDRGSVGNFYSASDYLSSLKGK